MKSNIHPEYREIEVSCACGEKFTTQSTYSKNKNLTLDICNKCHPFFTGKQKLVNTAGRVEKFNRKYNIQENNS